MNLSSASLQHPDQADFTDQAAFSDHSDDTDVRVLRCESTADFLAALPQLVGFTATDSLFVVFFAGKRSGNAIRVDLPANEDELAVTRFITGLVSVLQDLDGALGAGAPAIVITTSRRFTDAGRAPWRALARGLKRRLERHGVPLRELCCLAPDGWVSYLDTSAPSLGRSLDDIAASPIARYADPSPDIQTLGTFYTGDPKRTAAVQAALEARIFQSAEACAAALVGVAEPSDQTIAGIIHASNTEEGCIKLFDQLFATAAVMHQQDPPERPVSSMSSSDAARHGATARNASRRIRLASERLTEIVSLAPEKLQPAVIAVCALAWWLRGMQSVSHRQIAVALELEPSHSTANIVQRIIDSEYFPMMV